MTKCLGCSVGIRLRAEHVAPPPPTASTCSDEPPHKTWPDDTPGTRGFINNMRIQLTTGSDPTASIKDTCQYRGISPATGRHRSRIWINRICRANTRHNNAPRRLAAARRLSGHTRRSPNNQPHGVGSMMPYRDSGANSGRASWARANVRSSAPPAPAVKTSFIDVQHQLPSAMA